jgi:hypothetical protein
MDEGALGIEMFIVISVLFSLIAHWKLKKVWIAICSSVFLSVAAFQVASYIHLGYLDKYYVVAVVTSSLLALAISGAVCILFKCAKAASIQG